MPAFDEKELEPMLEVEINPPDEFGGVEALSFFFAYELYDRAKLAGLGAPRS